MVCALEEVVTDTQMYSLAEFCAAHRISRSLLYQLLKQDQGPRITKIGNRVLISRRAAEEWRERVERESANHGG